MCPKPAHTPPGSGYPDGGSPSSPRPAQLSLFGPDSEDAGLGISQGPPQLPPLPPAVPIFTNGPPGGFGHPISPPNAGFHSRGPPPGFSIPRAGPSSGSKAPFGFSHVNQPHSPQSFGSQHPHTDSTSANEAPIASSLIHQPCPPPESIFGSRPRSPGVTGIWPGHGMNRPQNIRRFRHPMSEKCFSLASTRVVSYREDFLSSEHPPPRGEKVSPPESLSFEASRSYIRN